MVLDPYKDLADSKAPAWLKREANGHDNEEEMDGFVLEDGVST